jgi:hypothetical protein
MMVSAVEDMRSDMVAMYSKLQGWQLAGLLTAGQYLAASVAMAVLDDAKVALRDFEEKAEEV